MTPFAKTKIVLSYIPYASGCTSLRHWHWELLESWSNDFEAIWDSVVSVLSPSFILSPTLSSVASYGFFFFASRFPPLLRLCAYASAVTSFSWLLRFEMA